MHQLVAQVRTQQWITMIREQRASGLSVKSWCVEKTSVRTAFIIASARSEKSLAVKSLSLLRSISLSIRLRRMLKV